MFTTNDDIEVVDRNIQFDGMIYYYKHGWLSNKWTIVYAKLWSDSTLEWFQSKENGEKPIGSILLNTVIPYFCVGPRIKNVPTKKPKMKATWDKNLLMAIATDIQASIVHWFYFGENNNFRKWIFEISQTLPRVILPQKYLTEDSDDTLGKDYVADSDSSSPVDSDSLKKQSSFNSLFNELFLNFGIGDFFFPMTVDSSDYENEIDSDNGDEEYSHLDNVKVNKFDIKVTDA